ncbi:DUF4129 domain-containing protein [Cellulomonas sp. URHD0024]|uniref:DUF4129 domain-containing protein n=1 Tax=Cellulomonas sp. URHD0024 TaxID=1302620 RepID=UPI000415620D|nr:DUF4129 domain-containing protein [Cellulomonas sp. URHD0024]
MNLPARAVAGALGLAGDVPVDPDAATARRWASDELLDPVYHQRPSLLSRLLTWLSEQLSGISTPSGLSPVALAVVVALIAAVVVVAFLVNGPVRRARRVASERSVLDAGDGRTSDQIRRAADAAAKAQDWTLAVLERFRAVVRSLEERTVLDERPARTAHEAADDAAVRLPGLRTDLVAAGRLFDAVAYGHESATPDDDALVRELDAHVRAARPSAPADAVPSVPR